jgi:hypothetical protein
VLIGKGVTAWRLLLGHLTSSTPNTTQTPPDAMARTQGSAPLPGPVATELVHALAGLAVALAGT